MNPKEKFGICLLFVALWTAIMFGDIPITILLSLVYLIAGAAIFIFCGEDE